MADVEGIDDRIREALKSVRHVSLRLFGEWFGGRPLENALEVVGVVGLRQRLTLFFDEDEVLDVWKPAALRVEPESIRIHIASRVLLQWYYYGRPHVAANLFYSEYRVEGDRVVGETSADWYVARMRPRIEEPAVELVLLEAADTAP